MMLKLAMMNFSHALSHCKSFLSSGTIKNILKIFSFRFQLFEIIKL